MANIGNVSYLHKKTGVLYWLRRVVYRKMALTAGNILEDGYFDYVVMDDIPARSFVCLYNTHFEDASPENPYRRYARPADMFFDGRFERMEESL